MAKERVIEGMRQPDPSIMQGEVISQMPSSKSSNPTTYRSVATMSDDEITSARTGGDPVGGIAVPESRLAGHQKSILDDQEQRLRLGFVPKNSSATMSGTADPMLASSGVVIGCKVYHKERKKEGKVLDISIKRGLEVRRDDGKKQWWDPGKVVKL